MDSASTGNMPRPSQENYSVQITTSPSPVSPDTDVPHSLHNSDELPVINIQIIKHYYPGSKPPENSQSADKVNITKRNGSGSSSNNEKTSIASSSTSSTGNPFGGNTKDGSRSSAAATASSSTSTNSVQSDDSLLPNPCSENLTPGLESLIKEMQSTPIGRGNFEQNPEKFQESKFKLCHVADSIKKIHKLKYPLNLGRRDRRHLLRIGKQIEIHVDLVEDRDHRLAAAHWLWLYVSSLTRVNCDTLKMAYKQLQPMTSCTGSLANKIIKMNMNGNKVKDPRVRRSLKTRRSRSRSSGRRVSRRSRDRDEPPRKLTKEMESLNRHSPSQSQSSARHDEKHDLQANLSLSQLPGIWANPQEIAVPMEIPVGGPSEFRSFETPVLQAIEHPQVPGLHSHNSEVQEFEGNEDETQEISSESESLIEQFIGTQTEDGPEVIDISD